MGLRAGGALVWGLHGEGLRGEGVSVVSVFVVRGALWCEGLCGEGVSVVRVSVVRVLW